MGYKTFWMQTRLPRQLKTLNPDIAHFTNSTAPLSSPCPTVITIHDMTLWLMPQHHPLRRLAAMRPIIPTVAQRAAAIIAVSQNAKADIVTILNLDPAKVHVVYEAPAAAFRPLDSRGALDWSRQKYHLPDAFILYVGTLEPRKNLVGLLEAFAQLRAAGEIPHSLVLVGDWGWKNGGVYQAISRLKLAGCVRFLGHIPLDDLVSIYNLADAMAFTSLYEGFGLPVIEAMACGTPVVTSPLGSLKEVAGDAAEYIDPTQIDSIADGLRRVLCVPEYAADLRRRGIARAAQFSWSRVAAETRHIYERVLESNR
jgi:glycosyltransferase involved in cell wall biosynthesis